MLRFVHIVIITLGLGVLPPAYGQDPISCDHHAYLSLQPFDSIGPFKMYKGDPALGINDPFEFFLDEIGVYLTCLGYSTSNYLYGLDAEKYELFRIGANGTYVNLGVPPGLDTTYYYGAGGMSADGVRMLLVAQNKTTGFDEKFISIRTDDPDLQVGSTSIISDVPIRLGDVAFDPYFGNGYGFDEYNQRLVNIGWPGGLVTSYSYASLNQVTGMGALFFDTLGVLHGYGSTSANGAETTLFTLNKANGEIMETRGGPGSLESDGCNCPYRIFLKEIVSEEVLLPCQEFTIQYAFWNTAGTVYPNITLIDLLPEGFEITEIVQNPYPPAGFLNSLGSATLTYDEFDLLLGQDTLIVKVRASLDPGEYSWQAMMDPFPAAFDYLINADDPLQPGEDNPNLVRIIGDGAIFPSEETYLCAGGTVRLDTRLNEGSFLWSDGSTASFLEADSPGWYHVEVTGNCGIYKDSIYVNLLPEPLQIELGEDKELRIGSFMDLKPTINTDFPLNYSWVSDNTSVNCANCPEVSMGPFLNDTRITLEAYNSFGCYDSDTLNVRVLKDRAVFMPNTFSPNDDGLNDWLFPQGLEYASIRAFRVFNRWGGLVFDSRSGNINDPNAGWDGRSLGGLSPEGVYLWQLTLVFDDGFEQQLSGDVLLIR